LKRRTDVITQTFESSSSSAVYTAQLDPATGQTSCTCPAWRFVKPGQPRACKHTRQLAAAQRETWAPADVVVAPPSEAPVDRAPLAVKPMLASAMTKHRFADFIGNQAWCLEEKFDGHRVLVRKVGPAIDAWSRPRSGKEALRRELPAPVVAAFRTLPDGVYDGELVTDGGRSWDVARLDTAKRFVIFDVIEMLGQKVGARPYTERREYLSLALAHYTEQTGGDVLTIPTSEPVTEEAVAEIWARGGEGAILKRVASTYQPGKRSDDWLKVKRSGSAVVTITGYEAGKCGPYSKVAVRTAEGHETTVKTKDNATLAAIAANPQAFIGRRLVISYTEHTDSGKFRHHVWDHLAGAGE
jgi:ATP-dependent DNA ligase